MNRCQINDWCLRNFPRRMFYLNKKKKINKSCLKHFLNEFMRKVENKMNKHVFVKEEKRFLIRDFIRNKKKWFAITVNWLAIRKSRIANWNPDHGVVIRIRMKEYLLIILRPILWYSQLRVVQRYKFQSSLGSYSVKKVSLPISSFENCVCI